VVTKKQRRKQLARASARRQQLRRVRRQSRRRLLQVVATILVIGLALAGLAVWIAEHSGSADAAAAGGYHAGSVDRRPMPTTEVTW
jgi:ferric-dicitrate binding protein FerR (iron transport regulator)